MNIRVRDNKIYLLDESKEWIEITDIVANKAINLIIENGIWNETQVIYDDIDFYYKVKLEKHEKNKSNVFKRMIKNTMQTTCNAIKQTLQDTSYISFYIGMICGSLLEVVIF